MSYLVGAKFQSNLGPAAMFQLVMGPIRSYAQEISLAVTSDSILAPGMRSRRFCRHSNSLLEETRQPPT